MSTSSQPKPPDHTVPVSNQRICQSIQFVVGIGASAGGLRSLERLFKSLPVAERASFVVVQHISPVADSNMDEILRRYTDMNVVIAQNGLAIAPATIYLIPPAKEIRLRGDRFEVNALDRAQIAKPIDTFFQSLAESFGGRSIAAVLSGTGSDGSAGISKIKSLGGTTLAESVESAQFDGMPKSATATNCVDLVLTPEKMAAWLVKQFDSPNQTPAMEVKLDEQQLTGIQLIFSLLSKRHDIEFSFYKPATVARRIERRQQICRLDSIFDYAQFVEGNVEELDILYHDLLIGVTKFFRDTDAFGKLAQHIRRAIGELPDGEEYRVWVAGCATGEEAYSVATLCHEAFVLIDREPNYKIFATDVHGGSLDSASRGIYDRDSMEFVAVERQRKFFTQVSHNSFRVGTELRRHLVFARHNVVQDPPFTRIDLVTCRNLLIYLLAEAQLKAIKSFHFALKKGGIMMMGVSESPGKMVEEFATVDETWKMYRKTRNLPLLNNEVARLKSIEPTRPRRLVNLLNNDRPETLSFLGLIESYDLILKEFIESGILLDDKRNVLHIFGEANRYLKSTSGRFSGDLMAFLDGDTKVAFSTALIRASRDIGKQIILQNYAMPLSSGSTEYVDVSIRALSGHSIGTFVALIAFQTRPSDAAGPNRNAIEEGLQDAVENATKQNPTDQALDSASTSQIGPHKLKLDSDRYTAMESELMYTKESLSATIEELETSNEELQAANEQLVASNEELQSTNQELHSVNEELYSVNAENQRKIEALEEMTDDVDNLLSSTDIGTILLDSDMNVRKFTPAAASYIKLLPSDIGRDLTDFATHIVSENFYEKVRGVIKSGNTITENSITKNTKACVLIRILPYLSNGKVNGAIVNFIDMGDNTKTS